MKRGRGRDNKEYNLGGYCLEQLKQSALSGFAIQYLAQFTIVQWVSSEKHAAQSLWASEYIADEQSEERRIEDRGSRE